MMISFSYAELRMSISDAASDFMHRRAPELPQLVWTYSHGRGRLGLSGIVQDGRYADPEDVAQQWRAALGLSAGTDTGHGTREFVGIQDGVDMRVWYVIDRDQFENPSR